MQEKSSDAVGTHVHPPLLFGGMLGLLMLYKAFSLPSPLPKKARFTGIPLILAGVLLGGSAVAAQRRAGDTPDPRQPVNSLVQSGPYRVTRNPMYLGMGSIIAGAALLMNAVWGLLLAPGFLLVIDRGMIRHEEGYMETKFGDHYRDYKSRVPKWI